jgi:hypothetical protein
LLFSVSLLFLWRFFIMLLLGLLLLDTPTPASEEAEHLFFFDS